jgi:hypothetical protein
MHLPKTTALKAILTAFALLSFSLSSAVNVTLDSRYSTSLMTIISNCNFEIWYQMCDDNCVVLNVDGSSTGQPQPWDQLDSNGLLTHIRPGHPSTALTTN